MDDCTFDETLQPSEATIAFLKKFARAYCAAGWSAPGQGCEYLN